ncbi:uncharacterized protein LOC122048364 [Zingiber officinale]|uniref:CCT domain-containing protein n=1 Tax=Zingiber officinale TaxID=94328 RepID=A0A8J5LDQ2_ZINOF|nr:uncharacterized protein LOC122048364 [Zingiber officinale]KAG6524383.1 hypothetical protein ZIOFF_014292 [Zingiber officinale]
MQEGISSPIAAQLFDFCDNDDGDGGGDDLFPASEDHQLLLPLQYEDIDVSSSSTSAAAATAATTAAAPSSPPLCFSPIPSFYALLDASPPPPQDIEPDVAPYPSSSSSNSASVPPLQPPGVMFSALPPAYNLGDPFDHIGAYSLDPAAAMAFQVPAHAFPDNSYCAGGMVAPPPMPPWGFLDGPGMGALFCDGMQGLYGGGRSVIEAGTLAPCDVSEGGVLPSYGHDAMMPGVYNSNDFQGLGGNSTQHLMMGCAGNRPPPATSTSDVVAPLEDSSSSFKVGRLSVEERKEKIHRYMKKRNQRNFTKKIKYACRKTLADSRPRVRGRFAKNIDEAGEVTTRLSSSSSHEFDEEEDEMVIKEEDILDSSGILAQMDSFKYSYNTGLESWI